VFPSKPHLVSALSSDDILVKKVKKYRDSRDVALELTEAAFGAAGNIDGIDPLGGIITNILQNTQVQSTMFSEMIEPLINARLD
jgi:hypothetical protein